MFLEMVKDMPRGRQESLSRMLVPLLALMLAGLGFVTVGMAADARLDRDLRQQVEQQATTAGVLFLEDLVVPRTGERSQPVIVDGRRTGALVSVDGRTATLMVPSADGTLVRAVPGG